MKTIASSGKGLSKEYEALERRGQTLASGNEKLQKNIGKLNKEVIAAKSAMQKAARQFKKTGDEADGIKLENATKQYEKYSAALKEAKSASEIAQKAMKSTAEEMRKLFDESGKAEAPASGGFLSSIFGNDLGGKMAQSGILSMAGDAAANFAGALTESALGQPLASLGSSIISGVASGAAAGAMAGIPGIGAAVGGVAGFANGITQIFEAEDEAFKSYVQEAHENQISEQAESLSTGSTLAAGRETDLISFTQLFGSDKVAENYLANMVDKANATPFLYEDLKSMSKTLATYGFTAEADKEKTSTGEKDYGSILDTLQTIGDAGAALGQSTSDMTAVATALGRMKSSDKTTLEYLNILNDRGIGAVGYLAEAKGMSVGDTYSAISKGEIAGTEAVDIILNAMAKAFPDAMEKQSETFSGLSSTVEGLSQELDNAMGEGYNEERKNGLRAQRDWLSGDSGEAVMEANQAIGAWKAELENSKEQYIREAMDAMMSSAEYQTAKEQGDAAEMGRLIMEAKVQGMNEYNASEGAQLALASERALADAIRDDTASNSDYWDAGYEKGQWFSKGLAAGSSAAKVLGIGRTSGDEAKRTEWVTSQDEASALSAVGGDAGVLEAMGYYNKSHAFGLNYVPYDEYPALLHQGERVLTAAEARAMDRQPAFPAYGPWGPRENPAERFSWGEEEGMKRAEPSPSGGDGAERNFFRRGFGWSGIFDGENKVRFLEKWAKGTFAFGLNAVPYDEFPALLHQGERVLTAAEARTMGRLPAFPAYGSWGPRGNPEERFSWKEVPQEGADSLLSISHMGSPQNPQILWGEEEGMERAESSPSGGDGAERNFFRRGFGWSGIFDGGNAALYDDFPALLHQGERVTPPAESRGSGNVNVEIHVDELHVRQDSDVDAVAEALFRKIQIALLRRGG